MLILLTLMPMLMLLLTAIDADGGSLRLAGNSTDSCAVVLNRPPSKNILA